MSSQNSSYRGRLSILLAFVIIIQVATMFLLYLNSDSTLKSNYDTASLTSADGQSQLVKSILQSNLADLGSEDGEYIKSKYLYTGYFTDLTFVIDGKTYSASPLIKDKMKTRSVVFCTMNELTQGASDNTQVCAVYCKTDKGRTDFLIQDGAKLGESFSNKAFNLYAVTNSAGKVVFGNVEFARLADADGNMAGNFFSGQTNTVDVTINSKAYTATASKVSFDVDIDLFFVGLLDITAVTNAIKEYSLKTISLVAINTLLACGLFIALGVSMRRHYDFLNRYTIYTKKKFVVEIDVKGKIKRSNTDFSKNINPCNIFENMVFFEKGKPVADGDSIFVSCYNKKNEKRLLNFLVSKKSGGFKCVGIDATDLFLRANANFSGEASYTIKELRAEYAKNIELPKMLLGVIEITNLHNLDLMFGRQFSEKVTDIVSERIKQRFGRVYILSGDRLGVLVTDPKEIDYTIKDIQLIMGNLSQAVLIEDNLVNVTPKIGFAISDEVMTDRSFDYAFNCANAALKRAKKEERAEYYVYHESQKKLYAKLMDKTWDIKAMLQAESFVMEFQPQISIKTGKPYGYEALFRIKRNLSIDVDIFELITYAERSGNMILLGEFIFNQGMAFAKSIENSGAHVSLNVSPVQLMQAGFVNNFLKIYDKYKLKPNSISVEITESFLMSTFDETLAKLELLKERGIDIHLDDFGVSYSSLLYLKKLPISAIKIDRDFVTDIEKNNFDKAIAKTIVDITKQLKLTCICEGIETQGQFNILKDMGCDVVQGYLTGKAMPAEEARKLVE